VGSEIVWEAIQLYTIFSALLFEQRDEKSVVLAQQGVPIKFPLLLGIVIWIRYARLRKRQTESHPAEQVRG